MAKHRRIVASIALIGPLWHAPLCTAADLGPALRPTLAAAPAESGWYLRGDLADSFAAKPRDATPANPNDPGMPPLVTLRLTHEGGYGGGVGYKVNGWLRVDATLDQRNTSEFSAYSSRSHFTTGYNVEAGKLDVMTGLVNAYADLGNWWGVTPYVGVGVGFADKSFRGGYSQTTCIVAGCDGLAGTGARTAAARPNHAFSSFAWGLTAGLSYRLTSGLSVDASYRYLDLGKATSGADAYGGSTRLKDLSTDEVRVGLRYQFAGGLLPVSSADAYGN